MDECEPLIRGDELECKCGAAACSSFDFPRVAYVLADLRTTARVVAALQVIHASSVAGSGVDVEVLVREWPGVDRAAVRPARYCSSDAM